MAKPQKELTEEKSTANDALKKITAEKADVDAALKVITEFYPPGDYTKAGTTQAQAEVREQHDSLIQRSKDLEKRIAEFSKKEK